MSLIPTIYNADTLGIRPDNMGRPIDSWSALLNPEFKGKSNILDISSIGMMDMAMVVDSMGDYRYPTDTFKAQGFESSDGKCLEGERAKLTARYNREFSRQ